MTNQGIINLVTAFCMWFNQIADPGVAFQKKDLATFIAPNFIMDMNDKITVEGYEELFKHFNKFRQSGYKYEVQYPFKEIIISDDKKKCIVRYSIIKTSSNNIKNEVKVIAIWHISADNKLERMNEVVFFSD